MIIFYYYVRYQIMIIYVYICYLYYYVLLLYLYLCIHYTPPHTKKTIIMLDNPTPATTPAAACVLLLCTHTHRSLAHATNTQNYT